MDAINHKTIDDTTLSRAAGKLAQLAHLQQHMDDLGSAQCE